VQGFAGSADVAVVTLDESPSKEFRLLARRWLDSRASGAHSGVLYPGGPRVMVLDSGHLPAGHSLDAALLAKGKFSCGAGCTLIHPVYAQGGCELGEGARAEAVYSGGPMVLGSSVDVRTWAESEDEMEIRSGGRVRGVAISRSAIQLGIGSEGGELRAPEIRTQAPVLNGETHAVDSSAVLEFPAPGNDHELPPRPIPGLDPWRLEALGAETWFYDGDLHFTARVVLNTHLVTRGYFACPAESLLEGDVRAGSALYIGERSLVRGRLSANGDLVMEAGAIFQDKVTSKRRVRLCSGVRGFRSNDAVTVVAGGRLILEDRVVVRGTLSSGDRVRSESPECTRSRDWSLAAGW